MPDRPDDMYAAGRDPVQDFDYDECGYHHVHPSVMQSDDTVDPANVQCPDFSSNPLLSKTDRGLAIQN